VRAMPQHSLRNAVLSSEPGLNGADSRVNPRLNGHADRIEASPVPLVVAASASGEMGHLETVMQTPDLGGRSVASRA